MINGSVQHRRTKAPGKSGVGTIGKLFPDADRFKLAEGGRVEMAEIRGTGVVVVGVVVVVVGVVVEMVAVGVVGVVGVVGLSFFCGVYNVVCT